MFQNILRIHSSFFGEARRDYETIACQISAGQITGVCCVGTGEVLEIAQMVFAAHKIEVVCVLDVLANESPRSFNSFAHISEEMASQIKCLVITETRRPHKAFEIVASCHFGKEILVPTFMKIKQSYFHPVRV